LAVLLKLFQWKIAHSGSGETIFRENDDVAILKKLTRGLNLGKGMDFDRAWTFLQMFVLIRLSNGLGCTRAQFLNFVLLS
jgi:hypothetical protein